MKTLSLTLVYFQAVFPSTLAGLLSHPVLYPQPLQYQAHLSQLPEDPRHIQTGGHVKQVVPVFQVLKRDLLVYRNSAILQIFSNFCLGSGFRQAYAKGCTSTLHSRLFICGTDLNCQEDTASRGACRTGYTSVPW